jgi:hypothetical protein
MTSTNQVEMDYESVYSGGGLSISTIKEKDEHGALPMIALGVGCSH